MDDLTIASTIIGVIVSVLVTLLAAWKSWYRFKRKIKAIREFIVTLDEALEDDRITEEEYRKLWQKFKEIVVRD